MSVDAIGCEYLEGNFEKNGDEFAIFLKSEVFHLATKINKHVCELATRGYHPDCPSNFQKAVCLNNHKAQWDVRWSIDVVYLGRKYSAHEHFKYLCNHHGCYYEFHDYLNTSMPPNCYYIKVK